MQRLFASLREFWSGSIPGVVEPQEFLQDGLIVQFGLPPNRIDLINRIDGVEFETSWPNRLAVRIIGQGVSIPLWFLGLQDLIANKRATARPKDLDDLRFLEHR